MHQRIHTNIYMYNMYKFWFLNMLQVKVDILLFKVRKDLSLIRTDLFIHVTVFVKLSNNNDQNMKHFYIFYYHNRKKQEHIHKHFSKLILCAFFPQNLLFSRSYMASLACLFVGSAQKKKKNRTLRWQKGEKGWKVGTCFSTCLGVSGDKNHQKHRRGRWNEGRCVTARSHS